MRMFHYNGTQVAEDQLPEGVDPSELTEVGEWFAQHKSVLSPQAEPRQPKAVEPRQPKQPKATT